MAREIRGQPMRVMRLFSRMPAVSRSGPLAFAVFVVGASIGAAAIVLTNAGTTTKRVVVKRVTAAIALTRPPDHTPTRRQAPNAGHAPVVSAGVATSFAGFARQLPGQSGLAVAPLGGGPITTLGGLQAGHAWSTMKVTVIVTLLTDFEHYGHTFNTQQQTDAALAVEQSDNAAGEALFGELERLHGGLIGASRAVQRTLRTAGDQTTTINTSPNSYGYTTWGQSNWSTSGEVDFYRELARGCLLDARDTAYVLSLMRNVVPSQRWGAGSAGYPAGVPLAFKGGWGPGTNPGGGYMVRQTAIVGSGGRGYVVSMIVLPSDGSFAEGARMITALATWAREHFNLNADGSSATCRGAA